ncbi:MAG: 4Fe-4S dicluster domain-containing protein [Bacteroidota bacterium]
MSSELIRRIRAAGVVGAGGAGFPAHVKAAAAADTVIANGAECEPLLHKDLELMMREPEAVIGGLRMMMSAVGASNGIIGVKRKYEERLATLSAAAGKEGIAVHWLGDFYPTGDEYILVYEATRRLIPPQGIPLQVGVVVNNVETLRNVYHAAEGTPVTSKFITVAGAVAHPSTFEVPVGISYAEAIAAAGGTVERECAVFAGGIMMGTLTRDLSLPVTKTLAGLVVLPVSHRLVQRKSLPAQSMHRIGKSACDQCSYCTEFCPRYLLGYDVQPHKVMRSLGFTATGEEVWNQWAQLCCSCGLCTLFACPEDLYPKEACDKAKSDLKASGLAWEGSREVTVHPVYDGRHVPLRQLIGKLGIREYDVAAPYRETRFSPASVRIPLAQHIGAPARPVVRTGTTVRAGDVVGEHAGELAGASVHASIGGVVSAVDGEVVIQQR